MAALQAVHDIRSWRESQGLLPANILLPQPVILKTVDHEVPLKVYPIQVLDGGRIGKGYARWRIAAIDAPKELVYVQWQPSSNYPEREIGIEAGIPENIPENWASIDLEDTYGLHYCPRCGYLTGVRSFDLPSELRKAHFHGRSTDELGDIMRLEEHDEFSLLAEFFLHRRGRFLTDIYQEHGIICPSAADYFPEPPLSIENVHIQRHTDENLYRLVRLIMQSDVDRGAGSPWASAARLLEQWNADDSVSKFGQSVFPLAMLLRTAAYEQQEFCRILTDSLLSENLIKNLLSEINEISPLHLQWALTWAELLIVHSPTGYKGI